MEASEYAFWNVDVVKNSVGVIEAIYHALTHPSGSTDHARPATAPLSLFGLDPSRGEGQIVFLGYAGAQAASDAKVSAPPGRSAL